MEEVSRMKAFGFDDAGIARAKRIGAEKKRRCPVALKYLEETDALSITMPSGAVVTIPRKFLWEIGHVPISGMRKIYLTKDRHAFFIDDYDVQISAMGLLRDAVMGEDAYAKAGSATSPAKARAARRNGTKGGRPRKKARR